MRTSRFLAAVVILAGLMGADWPRFRGPNGKGVVDDPSIPTTFTTDHLLHKVAVPGLGNGSPCISHGKLFLQAASEDGRQRLLHCFDAANLKLLWTATVPGGPGKTHAKNSLASSTPTADGGRVICLFWNGRDVSLHAFDFKGESIWQVPLGTFTSQHGAGQSPVLFGDKVYLNLDQDGRAELLAFDAATGKKIWATPRTAFRSCYSSPFIRSGANGPELVVASTAGVTAYDPEIAKIRWDWEWKFAKKPLRTVGSPIEADGVIVAISGDGDGSRHMVGVTPPNGDAPAKLAWELTRGAPYVPCPLARGRHVYCVTDKGFAMCIEAKSGKIVYEERFTSGITASPLLLNGHVISVDESGNLFSFPAQPKFIKPSKLPLGETVLASPAVADGRLYVRGERHLFVFGTKGNNGGKP